MRMMFHPRPTRLPGRELLRARYQGVGLVLFYYGDRIRAVSLKEGLRALLPSGVHDESEFDIF